MGTAGDRAQGGPPHPDARFGGLGAARQGQPITFVSGKALAQAVPCSPAGNRGCWPRALNTRTGQSLGHPAKGQSPWGGLGHPRATVPLPTPPCCRRTDHTGGAGLAGPGLFPSPRAGRAENISAPKPGVPGAARRPRAPRRSGTAPPRGSRSRRVPLLVAEQAAPPLLAHVHGARVAHLALAQPAKRRGCGEGCATLARRPHVPTSPGVPWCPLVSPGAHLQL